MLLVYLEKNGTGINHHVGLAALDINSVAPTYMNLTFALSLMGEMFTNKARTSNRHRSRVLIILFPYSILFF